jgi:hypothetical protein
VEENPYKSPRHADTSIEASLEEGEQILFQIAARSMSKRTPFFGLRDPVIGKFIVTNRRLMFLSSETNGNFGMTESSMVRRIANSVDFAAMSRKSSWEFALSEVRSVEASKYSVWTGCRLQLTGTDAYGMEVRHTVLPYGLKRRTFEELVTRINEMRQGDGSTQGSIEAIGPAAQTGQEKPDA